MNEIPVDSYLFHATSFKPEEKVLRNFYTEWLPENIIDGHAHCNEKVHYGGMEASAHTHMISTFPYYSLQESEYVRKTFFHPGKKCRALRFPMVFRGIDHRAANAYLLAKSPVEDRVALFGLPEDISYTIRMLSEPRVSALKMYYSYVQPTAQTIYETFKPEILAEAERLDKPIILHLPKMIAHSVDDLARVIQDFPSLRIVVAHLGSTKFVVPGLKEAYERLARYKTVYFDTALNPSPEVVQLALECLGSEKIMYGSDEPLHLIRSVPFVHPEKGQRIATDYPYHWVDSAEHIKYGHRAANAVHAHWRALGAVRAAIESLPTAAREPAKRRMFFSNASEVFGF
jgi:predicted TIM-barrel fold metal-dependent hydrolase